jgi:hypothetical protein
MKVLARFQSVSSSSDLFSPGFSPPFSPIQIDRDDFSKPAALWSKILDELAYYKPFLVHLFSRSIGFASHNSESYSSGIFCSASSNEKRMTNLSILPFSPWPCNPLQSKFSIVNPTQGRPSDHCRSSKAGYLRATGGQRQYQTRRWWYQEVGR